MGAYLGHYGIITALASLEASPGMAHETKATEGWDVC